MGTTVIPVGTLSAEQTAVVLAAATAAPCPHDTQPWWLHCTPDTIELHSDDTRALPASVPVGRELVLACGAALLNLRIAVKSLGVFPDVRVHPDSRLPDLVAVVRPSGPRTPTPLDHTLARAISARGTNRRPFEPVAVPAPLLTELRLAAEAERAWLAVVAPAQLPALRSLVHRAHATQRADPGFPAEWESWTGRDGGDTVGGPRPGPHDAWVLRDVGADRAPVRVPGTDVEPDPVIVVVGSVHDGPTAWVQAGQAMQRVLLTATAAGLSASFLSPLVEVPAVRRELRALIGGGLWPQAVLRVGYGSPGPPPRVTTFAR